MNTYFIFSIIVHIREYKKRIKIEEIGDGEYEYCL